MALQNFVLFVNILFMHLECSNSELTGWIHVVQLQKVFVFHKGVSVAKVAILKSTQRSCFLDLLVVFVTVMLIGKC